MELQLRDHAFLAGQGDARFSRVAEITATRGTITDRYGEPLAVSTPVDSVWVNPKELALASDQLPRLAKALKRDKTELARRVTSNLEREFLYLARHMQPVEAQKIRALEIPGVYLVREYRRYYPAGEVAGHIIGFTSVDDEGQEGLELAFDHWLAGEDGAKRVIQDRYGKIVQNVEEIRAMRPGRNLVLAIDLRIQYLAYRELKAAIRDQRAKSGSVIVLDVATGEVLAMVNQPAYNPNDRDQIKAKSYRNRAVTDIVEPGSSIKPFVVAAGLASGRFNDRSIVDTSPGYIKVGAKLLEDPHNLGAVNLATILAKSSNVGMTKVALSLEPAQMYGTLSALGFGQVTTSGYPGESAGLLPHYSHWRPVGISSMSRGYGLSDHAAAARACLRDGGVVRGCASHLVPARGDAARRRTCARPGRGAHAGPPAGVRGGARRRRQAGRYSGLHGGGKDRHGVEGHGRWIRHRPLSRRVRRHRPGQRAPARGRGHHRRARRRQVLRRRRGRAGVRGRRRRRVAPARGAARCAHRRRAAGRAPGGHAMIANSQGAPQSLARLLEGLATLPRDVVVSDLTQDGRAAQPGSAFLAMHGTKEHGLKYAPQAVANGARAVLWEPAQVAVVPDLPSEILVAPVPTLREHASTIADRFFGAPSRALSVAGITGTNGKTTCAYLLAQALEIAGRPAAYMGTIGTGRPRSLTASALTTGDAVTVQRTLARLRADGAASVAMEVSSHAIDQWRVGAVRFRTAAFTNLSRDHLDYHGSMDAYGAVKARLFTCELASRVINLDDAFGRQLAIDPRGRGRLIVTSRGHQSHARAAAGFVRAMHVELSARGIELEFDSSWGSGGLSTPLVGDFNVDNLLTVIAILLDWGLTPEQATQALAGVHAAPGRMETFGGNHAPLAIVDYAHTPDALRKALTAARSHCRGRLAVVFGCGGDRDAGKRPLMGEIAAELADDIVITDDNPRTEAPEVISAGIAAGIPDGHPYRIQHDRGRAIREVLVEAGVHDVVVIAGKGHEDYQIYGKERRVFSDQKVVAAALAARVGGAA